MTADRIIRRFARQVTCTQSRAAANARLLEVTLQALTDDFSKALRGDDGLRDDLGVPGTYELRIAVDGIAHSTGADVPPELVRALRDLLFDRDTASSSAHARCLQLARALGEVLDYDTLQAVTEVLLRRLGA